MKTLLEKLRNRLQLESQSLHTPVLKEGKHIICSAANCVNIAFVKGLCNTHYTRQRSGKPMSDPLRHREKISHCTECNKITDAKGGWGLCKTHYHKKRNDIIKQVCIDHLGGICSKCKVSYPICVYDFHHINIEEKEHDPSDVIRNHSLASIAEEIEKCVLLCSNCHRIEHHGE